MLDCWMAWDEWYTMEMCDARARARTGRKVLQPHTLRGFGRLNASIKSTRIATGGSTAPGSAIYWKPRAPPSGSLIFSGAAA
jgi:hypothetical protein